MPYQNTEEGQIVTKNDLCFESDQTAFLLIIDSFELISFRITILQRVRSAKSDVLYKT